MRVSSNTEVEARQSFAYVSEIKQAITVSSLPVYTSKIQDSQVKTPPFPQDFTRIKIFFQEIALKSNPSLCAMQTYQILITMFIKIYFFVAINAKSLILQLSHI